MTDPTRKTALITGGAKRLGRAMSLYLADRGFDVAVHYAGSAKAAQDLVAEIEGMGRRAVALQADLLDEDARQALLPRAAEALGAPLRLLVNNASIFERDTLEDATADSWERHFGSNLRAPFVLTQAFAAQVPAPLTDAMGEPLAQGLVINMIDQRVRKLTPDFMTYTLAKAALWTLTRTAAQALGGRVRVNGIGPGPTLQGERQSAEGYARQRQSTVLGRGANPADICAALGYFWDAPAVTGQLLCIDGGQHLAWQTPDVIDTE
ncbi:SDR family oxidoreductase [Thetidibacter halocola]|uniref:SDR family oxidoreductase n=1 Tax=Thetidibacter halocola TaxID=2827239 RepID=A0A8J7WGH9_9RHOB|nr:SDR family oxidoreductase [Thetidibacter halocola]MBS0124868.1 SDR family oxidoreductase [Thetidibacter halocola]